jgi:hypothetical protein
MKTLYISCLLLFCATTFSKAQAYCDTTGNVIIYSNYDGGILNINVDQNIPNLKIGVVTYEAVRVQISGAFASNVTEVRYAGYNGSNDNCSQGVTNTTISGVTNNLDTIIFYPATGYSNSNGSANIVCNYSCSSTSNQGGCNTPDQVVYYFMNAFGGTFAYHHTQYNCWTNSTTYNVSAGGNCCDVPSTLGFSDTKKNSQAFLFPNPASSELDIRFYSQDGPHNLSLYNGLGEKVRSALYSAETIKAKLDLSGLAKGIYFMFIEENGKTAKQKVVVE